MEAIKVFISHASGESELANLIKIATSMPHSSA